MSREAPVLILQYDSTEVLAGGAGNAANNVAALGGRARIVALTGRDEAGKRLQACLKRVDTRSLVRPKGYCTPVKTRILAGGIHTAKQQIVRIDRVVSTDYDAKSRAEFARAALKAAEGCDAILLSDYGTGLVTPELASAISQKANRTRRGADTRRFAVRPAAISRAYGVHAERVGGRTRFSGRKSATTPRRWSAPAARC